MNCLEFRRVRMTEPDLLTPEASEHLNECVDCERFFSEMENFDKSLQSAVDIPTPGNLKTRIKLRQAFQQPDLPQRSFRPWRHALAASLFLAVAAGGAFGYKIYNDTAIAREFRVAALDYLDHQLPLLKLEESVSRAKVARLVGSFGGHITGDVSNVQLAELCAVGDRPAAHLIVPGEQGPVSLIYTTEATVWRTAAIEDEMYQGIHVPTQSGSMAVFGEQDESLDQIVKQLGKSISW